MDPLVSFVRPPSTTRDAHVRDLAHAPHHFPTSALRADPSLARNRPGGSGLPTLPRGPDLQLDLSEAPQGSGGHEKPSADPQGAPRLQLRPADPAGLLGTREP